MFIDTHAHLSYPQFAAGLSQIVERASAAGVTRIVAMSTDLDDARSVVELTRKFPGVYAAVGLHPNSVPDCRLCDMKQVAELASQPKVVAIGETGLDYYHTKEHVQAQKDLLWAHLELARERNLPVVIHNRSAEADLMTILRAHAEGLAKGVRSWGVMHCFGGSEKLAFECLEMGMLISLTGILTFKNAGDLRDVAKTVPLEKVMLETDSPYLAPVPHRGECNEPAYIPHIAAVLAQIKGVSVDEVARITTETARRFFRIPE
jgi:TatD DNase family protein